MGISQEVYKITSYKLIQILYLNYLYGFIQ